jgi:hypothetical protein
MNLFTPMASRERLDFETLCDTHVLYAPLYGTYSWGAVGIVVFVKVL